jgi:hypothetical protein
MLRKTLPRESGTVYAPHKLECRIDLRDNSWALRGTVLWIFALLLFGFAGRGTAQAADIRQVPVTAAGLGPQFAIADFDGDDLPDVVSIQPGQNASAADGCWIELRLSAAGRQSIHLPALVGVVEARDANGDGAVDLVFSTAWSRQPVALYLNDGHGHFSRAEPAAFPGAFSSSNNNWDSTSNQGTEAVGVPFQSRDGISSDARELRRHLLQLGSVLVPVSRSLFRPCLISLAVRAPPEVLARN